MKRGSKEFEELQQQFEIDIKSMTVYVGAKAEREVSTISGHYYTNGKINDLFIAYMFGYQHAKSLARIDALSLEG